MAQNGGQQPSWAANNSYPTEWVRGGVEMGQVSGPCRDELPGRRTPGRDDGARNNAYYELGAADRPLRHGGGGTQGSSTGPRQSAHGGANPSDPGPKRLRSLEGEVPSNPLSSSASGVQGGGRPPQQQSASNSARAAPRLEGGYNPVEGSQWQASQMRSNGSQREASSSSVNLIPEGGPRRHSPRRHSPRRQSRRDSIGKDSYTGLTPQKGRGNYFHPKTKFPQTVIPPGHDTRAAFAKWYKDIMQREDPIIHQENSFLAADGRVTPLVVQGTDLVYGGADNSTWNRTFVRNVSPSVVRLASWTIDQLYNTTGWTKRDWAWLVGKWGLSCLGLIFLLPLSLLSSGGVVRNGAKYDPFPYKDWGYCKSPRNKREMDPSQKGAIPVESHVSQMDTGEPLEQIEDFDSGSGVSSKREIDQHFNPAQNRTLRPRYLCILNNPDDKFNLHGFDTISVEEWMRKEGAASHPDYLFVAYTAKQFQGDKDGRVLMRLAEKAARNAGLDAFWLAYTCLPDEGEDGLIEDVWRMSDIVRGAKRTAIVVGHPVGRRGPKDVVHLRDMLLGWGKRMWTLPEALLSAQGSAIPVYVRGDDTPKPIEKRSLAVQIWEDAAVSRQLMDHFEGSLILSQLELMAIALQCLNKRNINDFSIGGEMAYVLMGLLRRRPKVDLTDSAFQAFARLSLANDNNMLLERLICVMPKNQHQAWHDTTDCYDAKLYDIYPTCQIAGIGYDDSVVLDGAVGASIRWDQFERVAFTHKSSLKRLASRKMLELSPIILLIGLICIAVNKIAFGVLLLLVALGVLGASPYLVRLLWSGKVWDTQALFFGFEGYLDIATIEVHIFGTSMGRLTWSPFGSPLSRHAPGSHGECVGMDPTTDPKTAQLVKNAYTADNRPGDYKVFTLVDTLTMTATMFLAERPPVAVLLCGTEGGMQRAVLCSFQSETQTLCREAVLRMETRTKERMSLVARLRFSFKRLAAPIGSPAPDLVEVRAGSKGAFKMAFQRFSTMISAAFRNASGGGRGSGV